MTLAVWQQMMTQPEETVDTVTHPVFHIIEEPGGIEHLADCMCPTEEYYDALAADMRKRHPKASKCVLEHLEALEPFLGMTINAGFNFGVNKAQVAVVEGSLLGHIVSRTGASADPERTRAIREFAPLKDVSQVRQFLGSTNWIRWYMPAQYAATPRLWANS